MNNKVLQGLYSIGADAMSNMLDVSIAVPLSVTRGLYRSFDKYRLTGDVNLPVASINTYDVAFGPLAIKKPATGLKLERKVSITFRIDNYYQVYQVLQDWRNTIYNPYTGYVSQHFQLSPELKNEIALQSANYKEALGSIIVFAGGDNQLGLEEEELYPNFDDADFSYGAWLFDHVWIEKMSEPKFSIGGTATAQTTTVDFNFGKMTFIPGHSKNMESVTA